MPAENQPVPPQSEVSKLLLIVDGHAYAYRAFHAIRSLSSPTGVPTNAIFGFIKMLAKMRSWLKPTHLAVIWDGGLAAERMEILPEYKAQRPPMPDDLERQIDEIFQFLQATNIASLCRDGVEADDWIAALARHAEAASARVVIASSDKDFMQLVSARVGLVNPNDKSETVWTAAEVRAKAGVEPEQIVDWLSLMGDNVDNIRGVPGVGPKTAAELLRQFGLVSAIFDRLDQVKSEKLRSDLQASAGIVRRNQKLIRLNADLPCDFSWAELSIRSADYHRLHTLYSRWGFRSLLQELETARPRQSELF